MTWPEPAEPLGDLPVGRATGQLGGEGDADLADLQTEVTAVVASR
jgi:hypothetical protein